MRTSLSCDYCRRSKVKCVNSGTSPCQKCQGPRAAQCQLSRPRATAKKARSKAEAAKSTETTYAGNSLPTPDGVIGDQVTPHAPSASGAVPIVSALDTSSCDHENVDSHLTKLPENIIFRSVNLFTDKFPELAIIHPPTFAKDFQYEPSAQSKALLAAILAVTQPQFSVVDASWSRALLPGQLYAAYAKDMLLKFILQPPKIEIVQALLVIALHDWGSREFHKAWVHCGLAIRIMQALHSLRISPYPLDPGHRRTDDPISLGIETRTYWACFIMDCMMHSGTHHPSALSMKHMEKSQVPRPSNAVEFAFGQSSTGGLNSTTTPFPAPEILDVTQSFEIIARGFEIWAQIMAFILNDGRRAPGMCSPENCPWAEGSLWLSLKTKLEAWRDLQEPKLHYPENSVAAHTVLGNGESFTYMNLLYYLGLIMLHREYFPFLPTTDATPKGPAEPPFLEAEAPPGWWAQSAQEVFGAAEKITELLHDALECGVPLMTPFTGFCSFSACFLNVYVLYFPRMNLGRTPRAAHLFDLCIDYLKQFRQVWKLGDNWLKTINHLVFLYQRATADQGRYHGKSRADFSILHQSVHEFRVLDRSDQHIHEINRAEMEPSRGSQTLPAEVELSRTPLSRSDPHLSQFSVEMGTQVDDLGLWPQWWSTLDGA